MIIYRYENYNKNGPYTGDGLFRNHNKDWNRWPPPHEDIEDIKTPFDEELHCGFISLWKLKRWFNKEDRKLLKSKGYKLLALEVTEAKVGKRQCVFKRKDAKIIEEILI